MEIFVNQEPQLVSDHCSVQQLIDTLLPQRQTGMAVAVNNLLVPRQNWHAHTLQPSDKVIVIKATQGG
jgi:sulfur carrier protein